MTAHDRKRWATVLAGLAAFAAPAAALAASGKIPDPAADWNHLFAHVLTDITIIGVVFGLAAVYMLWKYRAKTPGQIGDGPKLTVAQAITLALVPAVVFLADDFYLAANGWVLFNTQRTVPAGALEVKVTGNQFYWEFDYGDGVTNDTDDNGRALLTVPVGKPVVLRLSSNDVVHSFGIADFRIKEDAVPGRRTFLWFVAKQPGKTLANCGEYCGTSHTQMLAYVDAVSPETFDAWLASHKHASAVPAVRAPNS
jgi:cytochrome c oxidase subunit II